MKNILSRNKKKITIILLLIIIFLSLRACLIERIKYEVKKTNDLKNILLESVPAVTDIKVWVTQGSFFNYPINITITFDGGGSITAFHMNKQGKEIEDRSMNFSFVNNYSITFFNKSNQKMVMHKGLELWSAVIGARLESIVDVAQNYHIISQKIENWTNLSDYKQGDERRIETIHRVIAKNQYSETVIFNGQEIILFKGPTYIDWLQHTGSVE